MASAKLQTIAMGFLKQSDQHRYSSLWSELENQYIRGQDQYPKDLTNACNLLLNYKAAPGRAGRAKTTMTTATQPLFLSSKTDA